MDDTEPVSSPLPVIPVLNYDDGRQLSYLTITEPASGELLITERVQPWSQYGPVAVVGLVVGVALLVGAIAIMVNAQATEIGIVLAVASGLVMLACYISLRRGGRPHYIRITRENVFYRGDTLCGQIASSCARRNALDVFAEQQFSLGKSTGVVILQTSLMRWSLFRKAPWAEARAAAKMLRDQLGLPEDKRPWYDRHIFGED